MPFGLELSSASSYRTFGMSQEKTDMQIVKRGQRAVYSGKRESVS